MKKSQLEKKYQLIPTDFATEEESEFWADFGQQHICTDDILPVSIFWIDNQLRNVYANEHGLRSLNAPAKKVIGHTPYNYLPIEIAESLLDTLKYVQETGEQLVSEHITTNYVNGEVSYWENTIKPLRHPYSGRVMGFYSVAVSITPEKKVEPSTNDFDKLAVQMVQEMNSLMNSYRIKMLYNRLGEQVPVQKCDTEIELTKREKSILYLLSLHRSPKDIADVLSRIDGKNVSHYTVHSLIGKGLYAKFGVMTIKDLLDKANSRGLIPAALH